MKIVITITLIVGICLGLYGIYLLIEQPPKKIPQKIWSNADLSLSWTHNLNHGFAKIDGEWVGINDGKKFPLNKETQELLEKHLK